MLKSAVTKSFILKNLNIVAKNTVFSEIMRQYSPISIMVGRKNELQTKNCGDLIHIGFCYF